MTLSFQGARSDHLTTLLLLALLCMGCDPELPRAAAADGADPAEEVQDEPPDPDLPCEEGEIDDCESLCAPQEWLGDGECDQAFNCETFIYDYGDCFFES